MKKTSIQLAWLIRRHGIEMTHLSGGSHIGAVLSVADIIAVLYADILRFDPSNPKWDGRDRLIMSKGHGGAAVYAALAEKGFFDPAELKTYCAAKSRLSGHISHCVPGAEFSTGSLGHGLSAAVGMALAAKQDGKHHRVFAILGDGECNEGSVWEAALFADRYRLENLVAVVDRNRLQSLDTCEKTLDTEDPVMRWRSFGWNAVETDGHDHSALREAMNETHNPGHRPTVIIADTVKGKGVSFMENDILWHYRFPHDGWEYDRAVTELHGTMPDGVCDPYTPDGIAEPEIPDDNADIGKDHTLSAGWHPAYI